MQSLIKKEREEKETKKKIKRAFEPFPLSKFRVFMWFRILQNPYV